MLLSTQEATEHARRLMAAFTERTGLDRVRPPVRYLWTDAHAVCNFLALARHADTSLAGSPLEQACTLVEQVHHVLGRYREDDPRQGWLSGLPEPEGAQAPTRGGLRIGKPLPECGADEPSDEQLEWDRDGQYFHYLTKWMHALDQLACATRDPGFNRWARELAQTARRAFTQQAGTPYARLAWKMSTDLSRPLVSAKGQHDALDGLITRVQLESTASMLSADHAPDFSDADALASLLDPDALLSLDPLGIGGLLFDASRIFQLLERGEMRLAPLLLPVLSAGVSGLRTLARSPLLRQPASQRLAFRELGLSIGLSAVAELAHADLSHVETQVDREQLSSLRSELERHISLSHQIHALWLTPAAQASPAWMEHRDINEVMLATSLLPEGFVVLPSAW